MRQEEVQVVETAARAALVLVVGRGLLGRGGRCHVACRGTTRAGMSVVWERARAMRHAHVRRARADAGVPAREWVQAADGEGRAARRGSWALRGVRGGRRGAPGSGCASDSAVDEAGRMGEGAFTLAQASHFSHRSLIFEPAAVDFVHSSPFF